MKPKRKPGRPKTTGRTVATKSVTMPYDVWQRIDEMRGSDSRGKFIAPLVPEKP